MSYFGCHLLYFPSGDVLPFRVVEINPKGFYQSQCPMMGERPGVVWLGGVCMLLPEKFIPQPGSSVQECLQTLSEHTGHRPLRLWKAEGLPVDADVAGKVRNWLPVF